MELLITLFGKYVVTEINKFSNTTTKHSHFFDVNIYEDLFMPYYSLPVYIILPWKMTLKKKKKIQNN